MISDVRNRQLRCLGADDGCASAGDGRVGGRERPEARQDRRVQSRCSNRRDVRRDGEGRHRREVDSEGFDAEQDHHREQDR